MFAPEIARSKAQAKISADSANGPARRDSAFASYRPGLRAPSLTAVALPKLVVGRIDAPLEREADCTADQIMRMPDPAAIVTDGEDILQRRCSASEEGRSEACKQRVGDHPQELARAEAHDTGAFDATAAPESVQEVTSMPGQALEPSTREFFEPRFGHDFSRVRVHAYPSAAASARALGAQAYTVGANIVFGHGLYQPRTGAGRRLLAHELAHVLQQGRAPRPPSDLCIAPTRDQVKSEARQVGEQWTPTMRAGVVQRQSVAPRRGLHRRWTGTLGPP